MLVSLVSLHMQHVEVVHHNNRRIDELESVVPGPRLAADGERPFRHHLLVS